MEENVLFLFVNIDLRCFNYYSRGKLRKIKCRIEAPHFIKMFQEFQAKNIAFYYYKTST